MILVTKTVFEAQTCPPPSAFSRDIDAFLTTKKIKNDKKDFFKLVNLEFFWNLNIEKYILQMKRYIACSNVSELAGSHILSPAILSHLSYVAIHRWYREAMGLRHDIQQAEALNGCSNCIQDVPFYR